MTDFTVWWVCSNCGTRNIRGDHYCSNCGYTLLSIPRKHPLPDKERGTTGALLSDTILSGRYRIRRLIGKGGFSAVYEATDERFRSRRQVALKEMSDSSLSPAEKVVAIQNFQHEANLLAALSHPNLPNVSDFFEEAGKAYLVMEFVQGRTLEKIQEDAYGPLDELHVMNWAIQLCDVLHYLHTQPQPIIFRDMKPSNVMITDDDQIKLIDFGIARTFKAIATKDTMALGSPGYAPLEQYARGQSDTRSDIYALGATLYELLTNTLPVDAPSRRINPSTFGAPRELNPSISQATEAIILKAMNEQPSDRFQSAIAMRQAISAIAMRQVIVASSVASQHTLTLESTIPKRLPVSSFSAKVLSWIITFTNHFFIKNRNRPPLTEYQEAKPVVQNLYKQDEEKEKQEPKASKEKECSASPDPATILFQSSKLSKDDLKDFFIIYHNTDFDWTEWVTYRLESEGYTTIVPAWGSRPGIDFQVEVSKALAKARRVLIILSVNYLKETGNTTTLIDILKHDILNDQPTFLPVWIGPGTAVIEKQLTSINHIDLASVEDEEKACRVLMGGVRGEYIRPTRAPRFPGATGYLLGSNSRPLQHAFIQSNQPASTPGRVKVFVSYAHQDEVFQKELDKYLIGLKRQQLIESWYDRMIEAGSEWEEEINKHLREAHVILLLVSQNFVASEYCYSIEVKQALERHGTGDARVIPIILSPALWEDTPIGKLQALPSNALPVTEWTSRERAFVNVAKEIQRSIEKFIVMH